MTSSRKANNLEFAASAVRQPLPSRDAAHKHAAGALAAAQKHDGRPWLSALPSELAGEIFSYCDGDDFVRLRTLNRWTDQTLRQPAVSAQLLGNMRGTCASPPDPADTRPPSSAALTRQICGEVLLHQALAWCPLTLRYARTATPQDLVFSADSLGLHACTNGQVARLDLVHLATTPGPYRHKTKLLQRAMAKLRTLPVQARKLVCRPGLRPAVSAPSATSEPRLVTQLLGRDFVLAAAADGSRALGRLPSFGQPKFELVHLLAPEVGEVAGHAQVLSADATLLVAATSLSPSPTLFDLTHNLHCAVPGPVARDGTVLACAKLAGCGEVLLSKWQGRVELYAVERGPALQLRRIQSFAGVEVAELSNCGRYLYLDRYVTEGGQNGLRRASLLTLAAPHAERALHLLPMPNVVRWHPHLPTLVTLADDGTFAVLSVPPVGRVAVRALTALSRVGQLLPQLSISPNGRLVKITTHDGEQVVALPT